MGHLVSIYIPVKNSVNSIERCVNSIIGQDYQNKEIIVQDGASTDGTQEKLKEFGSRINLISEPDSGPAEGLIRALKRCKGDILIACLADEELLEGAISWGVDNLLSNSELAVVYGDIYTTDIKGNIVNRKYGRRWDFKKVFRSEFFPYFCASFFRRQCIEKVGMPFDADATEFGLWWRLGLKYKIRYVPHTVAKFALHADQLSERLDRYTIHLPGRIREIEHICSLPDTSPDIKRFKKNAIAGCYLFNAERILVRQNHSLNEAIKNYENAQRYKPDLQRLASVAHRLREEGASPRIRLSGVARILFVFYRFIFNIRIRAKEKKIRRHFSNFSEVSVFGAWPGARSVVRRLQKVNVKITCFIDNSIAKQGSEFIDIPVRPVDYLFTDDASTIEAVVIASEESRQNMTKQLQEMGYTKKII